MGYTSTPLHPFPEWKPVFIVKIEDGWCWRLYVGRFIRRYLVYLDVIEIEHNTFGVFALVTQGTDKRPNHYRCCYSCRYGCRSLAAEMHAEVREGMGIVVMGIEIGVVPHPAVVAHVTPSVVDEADPTFPSGQIPMAVELGSMNNSCRMFYYRTSLMAVTIVAILGADNASAVVVSGPVVATKGIGTCHQHDHQHHYLEKRIPFHSCTF